MKKFLFIYALLFSAIWIGYGLYSVVTGKPSALIILGFGVAFSIIISCASWLSYWLVGHYKKIDAVAKNILTKKQVKE